VESVQVQEMDLVLAQDMTDQALELVQDVALE
jgi:hypothetical protein